MIEHYLDTHFSSARTLQEQIREKLIKTILSGCIPSDEALPSSRKLAQTLNVSRNTILCIYESLIDDGYLISKKRQGYFVSPDFNGDNFTPQQQISKSSTKLVPSNKKNDVAPGGITADAAQWKSRFKQAPSVQSNIIKPKNWADYEYPFIYGQVQQNQFPIQHWRNSLRTMMGNAVVGDWIHDNVDRDDPALIEQLRTRILPRRGIYVKSDEILMTMGTQNSLFLIAKLLIDKTTKVAVENPGFRDAHNIFKSFDGELTLHNVDENGLIVDDTLSDSDYVFVTPGHQVPTGAVLSADRRRKLMNKAIENDFIILEDDYDSDINLNEESMPALKSADPNGRVVYMGSLSKLVAPGLRMGYIVAAPALIEELRGLRRLIYRHPPTNNQRTTAHFIAQGFYDTHLRKTRELNREKRDVMMNAIHQTMPENLVSFSIEPQSSFWLKLGEHQDSELLRYEAEKKSILVEPGNIHYLGVNEPNNYFRLGFSAINKEKITPGIHALSRLIDDL